MLNSTLDLSRQHHLLTFGHFDHLNVVSSNSVQNMLSGLAHCQNSEMRMLRLNKSFPISFTDDHHIRPKGPLIFQDIGEIFRENMTY
jgi:hypothetical protein